MRAGNWPDAAVRATTARAFLAGIERDVDTVSLTSGMTAALAITDGAGDPATDGSVTWPQRSTVAVTVPQPFQRTDAAWPPVTGSRLVVEVGDGAGQWWRQVTGLVDTSSGSLASGQVESDVIDHIDQLSAQVWHDPLLSIMPPLTEGEAYRRVGLCGSYITDRVARAAGFYATPPANTKTVLSVPCMGSMWPEIGRCVSAHVFGDLDGVVNTWTNTDYGVAAVGPEAAYAFTPTVAINLTVCLLPQPDGAAVAISVLDGTRGFVFRQADDVLSVTLPSASGGATVVTLPRNGAERAAVRAFRDAQSNTLYVQLATSDGRMASATSNHPDFATALIFSSALLLAAGGAFMSAVLVDDYSAGLVALDAPQTALFRFARNFPQILSAMPAIRGEQAKSLLLDQATAQGASFWIDSDGRLRWADRGVLEGDVVKVLKTTELTVDNFAWTDNLQSVRSQVVLKRKVPAISRSQRDTILLWQGASQEMDSNQTIEEWVEAPSEVDWLLPDYFFSRISFDAGTPTLRYGSKYGVSYVDEDPATPDTVTSTVLYAFTCEQTPNTSTAKITHSTETLPVKKSVVTQISNDVVNMPRNWRGMNLPILRGRGKVEWSEKSASYPTGGPGTGTYEHDSSWWVQDISRVNAVAEWLLSLLTNPRPIVTAVDIDPDPRLELGDKVTIQDAARTGIEFDLVITRIAQSWGGDRPSMTLSGRVTRAQPFGNVVDPASTWETFMTKWKAS